MKAPEALLQEALAIAERMHAHLARSHHQVQPHIPLQAEQVPQLVGVALNPRSRPSFLRLI